MKDPIVNRSKDNVKNEREYNYCSFCFYLCLIRYNNCIVSFMVRVSNEVSGLPVICIHPDKSTCPVFGYGPGIDFGRFGQPNKRLLQKVRKVHPLKSAKILDLKISVPQFHISQKQF